MSGFFSGSTRHEDRRAQQLRQHLRGQSHQLLISSQQQGRFSARQSQIKADVNRVIQMTRESKCLHLKVTIGFDVIHERSGPAQAQLQAIGLDGSVGVDEATSACSPLSVRSFSLMFVSPPPIGTPSTQLSWSGLPDFSQMKRQPREV